MIRAAWKTLHAGFQRTGFMMMLKTNMKLLFLISLFFNHSKMMFAEGLMK